VTAVAAPPATRLTFTVLGQAQPAGSKRAVPTKAGLRVIDANPKSREWKTAVSFAAHEAMRAAGIGQLLNGPLYMQVRFIRPRPAGHYRTGRHAGELRPNASAFPTTKPDALKLARAVEDALMGIVYRDDAQIVEELIQKRYGEHAHVVVIVEEVR
jgi:crossover junction endodeoxyribonuclease RusA